MNLRQASLLDSSSQMLGRYRLTMGIDAEIVPIVGKRPVLPHQVGLDQVRPDDGSWYVTNGYPAKHIGDWHGDGYAFEVCSAPITCLDVLLRNLGYLFYKLHQNLKINTLTAPTLYTIPVRVASTAPDDVKLLGCAPSFNAYDDAGDPSSLDEYTRTTGCHLHVSHPSLTNERYMNVVKWADIFVGAIWTYLSPEEKEEEQQRRLAYGRAGEHRRTIYKATATTPKSAGVEYRVLPGRVLTHPAYLTMMLSLYRSAVRFANAQGAPSTRLQDVARKIINNADKRAAVTLVNKLPITDASLTMLRWYKKYPLNPLTATDWFRLGIQSVGHRVYFQQNYGRRKAA